MRVVFALGGNPERHFAKFDLTVRSVLISFHYKNLLRALSCFPDLDYLLLDSGAFSAWAVGAKIDVAEYADWISAVKEQSGKRIKRIEAINLDVITNRTDSPKVVTEALKKSMENLYYLKSRGHNVLPVHHQFEPYSVLAEYQKEFDFICISPNNREHTNSKRKYLDNCFSLIKATRKTHGLAVTAEELMWRYPWFSVDSSIVQTPYRYGRIGLKKMRHVGTTEKQGASRNEAYLIRLAHETIKHLIKTADTATALWKRRGVEWTV